MAEGFKGKVLESGGDAGFSSGPSGIPRVPTGTGQEGLVREGRVPVEAETGLHGGGGGATSQRVQAPVDARRARTQILPESFRKDPVLPALKLTLDF